MGPPRRTRHSLTGAGETADGGNDEAMLVGAAVDLPSLLEQAAAAAAAVEATTARRVRRALASALMTSVDCTARFLPRMQVFADDRVQTAAPVTEGS